MVSPHSPGETWFRISDVSLSSDIGNLLSELDKCGVGPIGLFLSMKKIINGQLPPGLVVILGLLDHQGSFSECWCFDNVNPLNLQTIGLFQIHHFYIRF